MMNLYRATLANQNCTQFRYIFVFAADLDRAKELLTLKYDFQSFIRQGAHLQSFGQVEDELVIVQE